MRKSSVLIALLGLAVFARAQEMNPEPPKEISDLSWMVGKWSGDMEFTFGGQTSPLTMTIDASLELKFLKMVTVNDVQGFKMNEVAYIHWDAKSKQYTMTSFTDLADTPRIQSGAFKDGAIVMVSQPWEVAGAGATVSRSTVKKVSDKEISFTLEFKDGDSWTTAMKGTLKKKS